MQMYETQIRTITNCMICEQVNFAWKEYDNGSMYGVACIDHDHDTGEVKRGSLSLGCNTAEGMIPTEIIPILATTYAKNLVEYLENPPLSESWMQKS